MGTVYLVGAGPGDPNLLTLRAAHLLSIADVVVYDALVHPAVLERATHDAKRRFVGKRAGEHSLPQETITTLLLELARDHEVVVRLKGGDPFVFGRGGEEAEALVAAGIPYEVVPGVTAGIAAPAYAGIPVTHRGASSAVTLVTGHEDPTKEESDLDWSYLANGASTLVFYMGLRRMEENLRRLVRAGRAPSTPAAVIQWGTYPQQRTVVGTVENLAAAARDAGIEAPALVVVGEVVALRERLAWFEKRPLFGKRVVVTRARAQASRFAAALEELGADVLHVPTIRIGEPFDPAPLRAAVEDLTAFDWVVLTSANGVEHFWTALRAAGRDTRALAGLSLCAIGPATAAAMDRHGARADLIPDRFVSEAVVEALRARQDLTGTRILLPRADVARAELPELLSLAGAEVSDVIAYRTVAEDVESEDVRDRLREGAVDLITFTSASTVTNFVSRYGTDLGEAAIASIGPITSAAIRAAGLPVDVEAAEYTTRGLIDAILERYAGASDSLPASR